LNNMTMILFWFACGVEIILLNFLQRGVRDVTFFKLVGLFVRGVYLLEVVIVVLI
jgi:hypothetical protein